MVSRVQQGKFVYVDDGNRDLDSGIVVHRAELDSLFGYRSRKRGRVVWTDARFVREVLDEQPNPLCR